MAAIRTVEIEGTGTVMTIKEMVETLVHEVFHILDYDVSSVHNRYPATSLAMHMPI